MCHFEHAPVDPIIYLLDLLLSILLCELEVLTASQVDIPFQ